MIEALIPDQLRKTYAADYFKGISETLPDHRMAVIGQKRVRKALYLGLKNRSRGFNVYISAHRGKEKWEALRPFLEKLAENGSTPKDWCYVNNFEDSYRPVKLELPQGMAMKFKKDIRNFINQVKQTLEKVFQGEEFRRQQNALQQKINEQQKQVFAELNEKAKKEGFMIQQQGPQVFAVPMKDGEQMSEQDFHQLDSEEQEEIMEKQQELQQLIQETIRRNKEFENQANEQLAELERETALSVMEDLIKELREKYAELPKIKDFLDDLKEDILDNLSLFLQDEEPEGQNVMAQLQQMQQESLEQRYDVNVLVDNGDLDGVPVVVEFNPTYDNLFGKIEREPVMGTLTTNFSLLRPGALHRANGGYLILPVKELLMAPLSWENFKRALRARKIQIEDLSQKQGFVSVKSLKPEPIDLDVQVLLLGPPQLFSLLNQIDEDFQTLFKLKADFDPVIDATEDQVKEVGSLLQTVAQRESLSHVSPPAISKLIEYGHREAAHHEKISAEFELLSDIMREADFYAAEDSSDEIRAEDIQKAIREKKFRSDLMHEKIKELIDAGSLFIDVEGEKAGQINGLSVIQTGDIIFGRPNRITASVGVGKEGIIDIEREAKLGGPVHTKGVMILSGFLNDKFGRDKPLSLSLRLVFEQSYNGVDGDSASSAELYTILSRLSGLSLRQGLAVTGSINQKGEIQPVGGINEKIEGFFEVCKQKGLTGDQGVLIPASNMVNLMLKEEVVEAAADKKFSIWPVETIDEGIELLTGVKAGKGSWDEEKGVQEFEADSVFGKADRRLRQMAEKWKALGVVED